MLFPAYAGVILSKVPGSLGSSAFPRLRGGDPNKLEVVERTTPFSPPTRG